MRRLSLAGFQEQVRAAQERVAQMTGTGAGAVDADAVPDQALQELATLIEELRVAEEELRQQTEELAAANLALALERERYQDLFDLAPDGYLETDDLGIIREANRAAAALLGVEPRFLVGKPLTSFVEESQRVRFRTDLLGPEAPPSRRRWEGMLQPRKRPAFRASIVTAPVLSPGGQANGRRWTIRDVTEQWRRQEELADLYREMEQRVYDRTAQLELVSRFKSQLLEAKEAALKEAEEARERLAFLDGVSTELAASLDYGATMDRAARLAVPSLADWCSIEFVAEFHEDRRLAVAHRDPGAERLLRELRERLPGSPVKRSPSVKRMLESGEPLVITDCAAFLEEVYGPHEEHLGEARKVLLGELGLKSMIVAPLMARGRALGAMTLASCTADRTYQPSDAALARDLAWRVALAADNARLYRRAEEALRQQHRIAETLQQCFLPRVPDKLPCLQVGHTYVPAWDETLVGGDFYDVFMLDETHCGLVMGDVSGKGVDATVATAISKYVLRGFASECREPATVLRKLDRLLYEELREDRFVTLFFGILDIREGRLVYASAGHEPGVLEQPDGRVDFLEGTGPVLGVLQGNVFLERSVQLRPGATLFLYTDGLTEARRGGEFLGPAGVADLVRATRGKPVRARANTISSAVQSYNDGPLPDDLALLVVRYSPG